MSARMFPPFSMYVVWVPMVFWLPFGLSQANTIQDPIVLILQTKKSEKIQFNPRLTTGSLRSKIIYLEMNEYK